MSAKTISVQVMRRHIQKGRPDCCYCPVALALNERTGRAWTVSFFKLSLNLEEFMATPRSVSRFIVRFDKNKPVKPFRFRIPAKFAKV